MVSLHHCMICGVGDIEDAVSSTGTGSLNKLCTVLPSDNSVSAMPVQSAHVTL